MLWGTRAPKRALRKLPGACAASSPRLTDGEDEQPESVGYGLRVLAALVGSGRARVWCRGAAQARKSHACARQRRRGGRALRVAQAARVPALCAGTTSTVSGIIRDERRSTSAAHTRHGSGIGRPPGAQATFAHAPLPPVARRYIAPTRHPPPTPASSVPPSLPPSPPPRLPPTRRSRSAAPPPRRPLPPSFRPQRGDAASTAETQCAALCGCPCKTSARAATYYSVCCDVALA